MLLNFFQIRLKVSQLVFELPPVNDENIQKFLQLHTGISRAVVEVNDLLRLAQ